MTRGWTADSQPRRSFRCVRFDGRSQGSHPTRWPAPDRRAALCSTRATHRHRGGLWPSALASGSPLSSAIPGRERRSTRMLALITRAGPADRPEQAQSPPARWIGWPKRAALQGSRGENDRLSP